MTAPSPVPGRCPFRAPPVGAARRRLVWLATLLGFPGCAGPTPAPTPEIRSPVPERAPEGLDARVARAMTQSHAPGVVVLLVAGDSVVFERSYGVADPTTGAPMTPDVVLDAGEVVSVVTGVAMAHLAEQGRLALDAPVFRLLPEVAEPVGEATVGQLLTHTGGLALAFVRGPVTRDDLAFAARWLTPLDVVAPPGLLLSLSGTGPLLAARALEVAAAAPFPVVIEREALAPLGMSRSTLRHDRALELGLSPGHVHPAPLSDEVVRREPEPDSVIGIPRTGLYASPRDLARLAAALLSDGVVAGERRVPAGVAAAVVTPRVAPPVPDDDPLELGYGTRFGEWEGRLVMEASAADGGHAVVLRLLPRRRLAVVVASNATTAGGRLGDLGDFVLRAATGTPERSGAARGARALARPRPVELDVPAALAGTYRNGAETFEIEASAEGLVLVSGDLRLRAALESDGLVRARIEDGRVAMELRPVRDPQGTLYLYFERRAFRRTP